MSRFVGCLDFSPDGRALAGADQGCHALVWDLATGERIYQCKLPIYEKDYGDYYMKRTLRWAPDGRHLAVVNGNGTIYILRLTPPGH